MPTGPRSTVPPAGPTPRPAATIILLRDTPLPGKGFEVLLMRRHSGSGFAASAWVFPGGVVDPGDGAIDEAAWTGIDPEGLADRFALDPEAVLAFHVAAVRETFEEAGVLLAHRRDGEPLDPSVEPFIAVRRALNDRAQTVDWAAFLRAEGLVLDLGAVTYLSRWVTPAQEPRRYDTAFFVARMPVGVDATPDHVEMTRSRWMSPADALADDETQVIFPTAKNLEVIRPFETADAVIAHAAAQDDVPIIQPHILVRDDGSYEAILLPDDERYPHEVYR